MSCDQCGQPCNGRLCQMCETAQACEKLHGTANDDVGAHIDASETDDGWEPKQQGLDGEPAAGQTTLTGALVYEGDSDDD